MAVRKVSHSVAEKLLRMDAINVALKEERPVEYGQSTVTVEQLEESIKSQKPNMSTSFKGNSENGAIDLIYSYICNFRDYDKAGRLAILKVNKKYVDRDLKLIFNR
jgi:hypothetical protein